MKGRTHRNSDSFIFDLKAFLWGHHHSQPMQQTNSQINKLQQAPPAIVIECEPFDTFNNQLDKQEKLDEVDETDAGAADPGAHANANKAMPSEFVIVSKNNCDSAQVECSLNKFRNLADKQIKTFENCKYGIRLVTVVNNVGYEYIYINILFVK